MKELKLALLFASLLFLPKLLEAAPLGLFPKVDAPYFNPDQFSECLGEAISSKYNTVALYQKLNDIDAKRNELAKTDKAGCADFVGTICGLAGPEITSAFQKILIPLACNINEKIVRSLLYHSQPLHECDQSKPPGTPSLFSLLAMWENANANKNENLNGTENILPLITKPTTGLLNSAEQPTQSECILSRGESLVKWMLEKAPGSISHWELFKKAMEIYGDPFEALQIIGTLFDSERLSCRSRSKGCLLGNRMKHFFPPESTKYKNPVGENYHFWAQLNASLTENTTMEEAANYALEWLKDQDDGEYTANRAGISVGYSSIRHARILLGTFSPMKPASRCKL